MGILDLFRRKKPRDKGVTSLFDAMAVLGKPVTPDEIGSVSEKVSVEVRIVFPEELTKSWTAELMCTGVGEYEMRVSAGCENLSQRTKALSERANMTSIVSELCRLKDIENMVLTEGQKMALSDPIIDGGHPLYTVLFGEIGEDDCRSKGV